VGKENKTYTLARNGATATKPMGRLYCIMHTTDCNMRNYIILLASHPFSEGNGQSFSASVSSLRNTFINITCLEKI
jgi:hypothetical protein